MINLHCKTCTSLIATEQELAFYKHSKCSSVYLIVKNEGRNNVEQNVHVEESYYYMNRKHVRPIICCNNCNIKLGYDLLIGICFIL